MEEIDDELATFWNLQDPWICLILKIKTTRPSYFLQNIIFFFNFEKKRFFLRKSDDFEKYAPLGGFSFFFKKHQNSYSRLQSVTKFWKLPQKSSKNQANSWVSESPNTQESVWTFFCFFLFFETLSNMKGFFDQIFQKNTKILKFWDFS